MLLISDANLALISRSCDKSLLVIYFVMHCSEKNLYWKKKLKTPKKKKKKRQEKEKEKKKKRKRRAIQVARYT